MLYLNINWNEYFFHRCIFGITVTRKLCRHRGVEIARTYKYKWNWDRKFGTPWHRCWKYDHLIKEYMRDKN